MRASFALVLIGLVLGAPLDAQLRRRAERERAAQPRPAVALVAGPSPYDLAGTGTGFAAGLRFDVPSGRVIIIEPGIGFFRYTTDAGNRISYLLPEVAIQAQIPGGRIRPYLGAGGGFAELLSGRGSTEATLHAAGGIRLDLGDTWGARSEVRLRSIHPFTGETTDLTVGLSRRLGRRR